jgi:hypothetical protein
MEATIHDIYEYLDNYIQSGDKEKLMLLSQILKCEYGCSFNFENIKICIYNDENRVCICRNDIHKVVMLTPGSVRTFGNESELFDALIWVMN